MLPPVHLSPRYPALRLFLAPMAGITDVVFRTLMRSHGAHAVISELLSAEGLVRGGSRTWEMLRMSEGERPVGIQIFGSNADTMAEAARRIEGAGADFVDINFGCPVRKVVTDGAGAAWLKEPARMGELLQRIRSSIQIPLTIKVRTGWDEKSINLREVLHVAAESGVHWMAIHGRTRAQGYSGLANWELIRSVAVDSPIPIIGNGDILSAEGAWERLRQGYCHGVMIGRGALKNPWIFAEMGGAQVSRSISNLIAEHFDLALQYKERTRAFLSLKKFFGWYAAGYPHSGRFRKQLFETTDVDQLRALALAYFDSLATTPREIDRQPFLMGGHG